MANTQRGELGVEVGGKAYTLRPTFDALCSLEEVVGKPVDEILAGVNEGRLSGIRSVTWCVLQDAHGAEFTTLKQASEWIELAGGVDIVLPWLHQVLEMNAPETVRGGADGNPRRGRRQTRGRDGTGARSRSTPGASV